MTRFKEWNEKVSYAKVYQKETKESGITGYLF